MTAKSDLQARKLLESMGLGSAGPVKRLADVPAKVAFAGLSPREFKDRGLARAMEISGMTRGQLESQLIDFLSMQYGVPTIYLREFPISADVLALLPAAVATTHGVLPIVVVGKRLVVATDDPGNEPLLKAVARFTGYEVEPVVTAAQDLEAALARLYGQ